MQHRMKEFTMKEEDIRELLEWSDYGHISTICSNGYPYTVAVHYVYLNDKIYFHGCLKVRNWTIYRIAPKYVSPWTR